ncbi:hypothetical protein DFH09DRAFT_1074554 [Mycena vulgaris]|nr:hypothetical protein DFH09DRAFT_1074554 [Mycena vulgaris]
MSSPTPNVLGTPPLVPNGTRNRVPATPRKRKIPAPDHLLGVKELKETLQEIRTGYRKIVIFEALAALNNRKIVLVVCPLKALERDQASYRLVNDAKKKGLKAVMVNEDTICPKLWADPRQGRASLYYVSP